ncbi:MAG: glycosyltransferase family 39 protein [Chitinophagales bacterium]|nr:glycosyltransferase family 39 protein [Chitinophagales bacterium]
MSKKSSQPITVKKATVPNTKKQPSLLPFNPENPIFKKVFFGLIALLFVLIPLMSLKTGINGDERFQVFIAKYIGGFYTSFGKDKRVLLTRDEVMPTYEKGGMEAVKKQFNVDQVPQENNLKNYGGLFELLSATVAKMLGYSSDEQVGFHTTRHVLLGLITALIILFAGLTAKELLGWRAAIITALLLFVSPRFIGDGLMNNKDIPFALGYMMSTYFMLRFIKQFPKPDIKSTIGVLGGIAIAMGIRVGGLLLIMEFGLFCIIAWFYAASVLKESGFDSTGLRNAVIKAAVACFGGYFLGVFFWPYGLLSPISNPLAVLEEQSKFPVFINQLFEGEVISSKDLPWYYLSKFILITSPIVVLLGLPIAIYTIYHYRKNLKPVLVLFVVFVALFPLLYISYQKANVYNAWRHVLFIYAPLVVLSGIGFDLLLRLLQKNVYQYVAVGVMAVLAIMPLSFIAANTGYAYVYFNPLVGGMKGAYGQYVTDYWMISTREATEWLVENEIKKAPSKVVVASDCVYPVQVYLNSVKDKASLIYSRYYDRSNKDWDYGIFYSEFVNPYQLQKGLWPPDGTIYEVKAGGIPLCAVVKRTSKADLLGQQAMQANNFPKAVEELERAKQVYPRNEAVYTNLGLAYLNMGNVPKGIEALSKSFELFPSDPITNYYLGVAYVQNNPPNVNMAIEYVAKAVQLNPGFTQAQEALNQLNQMRGNTAPRF